MCLLSYADNKNAVAQIGDENREGGYTIFPRKLKSKKIYFKISSNELQIALNELPISSNELKISSNRAIYTYNIQYNLSTPALVYSGFLSNPAKTSGPNDFPIYLNLKNTSVLRIL